MNPLILDFKTRDSLLMSIPEAEAAYENQIIAVADALSRDTATHILSLSGPTCSGKTTTASRLTADLKERGRRAIVLSIDDFYLDRSKLDQEKEPDYESFEALDSAYLAECVDRLQNGKSAMIPRYDFSTGSRSGYTECVPEEGDLYIFEGIQALYPETMALYGRGAKSLFICVNEDAVINGIFFDKTELRLIRRLLRDYNSRSASADFTLTLWKNVRANEEKNIFPYSGGCDFSISSYLSYETPIIARPLMGILSEVPEDSVNAPFAHHLQSKLSMLLSVSADTDTVPRDSILREFTENTK